jgi:Rieske Fe-S protein
MTAHTGVYVRNEGPDEQKKEQFLILAVNCAHLGCPVSWFPQSGLFMCPCHGGVYYANGERASGPPPRGLFKCVWRINGGQLEVQAPHYPTLQDTLDQPA